MATWAEVSVSIAPYYIGGYWLDGTTWVSIYDTTEMVGGRSYLIYVSQDCTLSWDNFSFNLTPDGKTIVWPTVGIWEWIKANRVIAAAIGIGVYLVARGQ